MVIDRVYKATMVFGLINCGIGSLQAIDHLPHKMWYPWNTENSLLGYWAAAFHQIFASTAGLQISIGINILPVIFMTYTVGFIEILCEMLESLKKLLLLLLFIASKKLDATYIDDETNN